MKRFLRLMAFLTALACLAGCATSFTAESGSAVTFYYRDAARGSAVDFGSADGALGAETHIFTGEMPTYDAFLNFYFSTPEDPDLESPFPTGLQCLGTSLDDGVLTVLLSDEFDGLAGMDRSIAAACITRTLTQFESVSGVCLETGKNAENGTEPVVLSDKDFICQDLGAVNTETAVRLYFADTNGRYLVSAERKNYFSDAEQIPAFVVQQLIEGPSEEGQIAVMPEGTALRDITVDEDGACVVNLSSEFLLNKPTTELMERMTVLSLVDSLTELESIKSVRILVEGEPVGRYLYLDLNRAYQRDESAIDMVRAGLNETDATLYVGDWDGERLAQVPVSIRRSTQMSLQEVLLRKLLAFEDRNGLENPLPDGTTILHIEQKNGTCRVDFSKKLLECAGDEIRERLAIRAVVSTLTSLDGVTYVKLSVNGRTDGFEYYSLERLYAPLEDWFR